MPETQRLGWVLNYIFVFGNIACCIALVIRATFVYHPKNGKVLDGTRHAQIYIYIYIYLLM